MVVLLKTLQVLLALSILIVIHELGHFTFARIFGIRVDKFFLFFDVGGVKLFSTKKSKWFTRLFPKAEKADTEYGIGWLPLGGYCKISGMVDESLDLDALGSEPKKWEFRAKPAWQRLLVMAGGILFNFIFAIAVYVSIFAVRGDSYLSNEDNHIYVNDLAYDMGFRTGDRILSFDDYVPEDFSMLQADLARRSVRVASVLRGNDTVQLYIDRNMIGKVLNSPGMFSIAAPFVVDSLAGPSAGGDAGLMPGDRLVRIDSTKIDYIQDAQAVFSTKAGGSADMLLVRGGDTIARNVRIDSTGHIGVFLRIPGLKHRDYTVAEAIPAGVRYTLSTVTGYARDLKLVATPGTGAYKSVGSFIAIGQVFPSQWNWLMFIDLLALFSIMLGVMNLLPIPALDGGHIVFLLYEMATGRKPSVKFMTAAQMAGMLILLMIMFLAFGNDIGRLLR